eukprot:TRINITY_DN11108_c2_g1_i1.p1 TRINITY_DN11108_c2_g1~~TRINITY_DN11108_c2_g1_i1.p1  ORF type:complete len:278 (+),score=57.75 TRINITY_DN11108_c2_g1_i1:91-834(+)
MSSSSGWAGAPPSWIESRLQSQHQSNTHNQKAPRTPEELLAFHCDLTKYHHQAMAHHFGMIYHHHNLACTAFMNMMGPEFDFRTYRPSIPPQPELPNEWLEKQHLGGYSHEEMIQHAITAQEHYAALGEMQEAADLMAAEGEGPPEITDPELTTDEKKWLTGQMGKIIDDQVDRELEAEAQEPAVPELIVPKDGSDPSAEDMQQFMQQVEVVEAWQMPITSITKQLNAHAPPFELPCNRKKTPSSEK